jgi:hypothetical protein
MFPVGTVPVSQGHTNSLIQHVEALQGGSFSQKKSMTQKPAEVILRITYTRQAKPCLHCRLHLILPGKGK